MNSVVIPFIQAYDRLEAVVSAEERREILSFLLTQLDGQVDHVPPPRARLPKGIDHELMEGGNRLVSGGHLAGLSRHRGRAINPNSLRQRLLAYLPERGGDFTETIAQALGAPKSKVYSSLSQLKWSKLVRGGKNGWYLADQPQERAAA